MSEAAWGSAGGGGANGRHAAHQLTLQTGRKRQEVSRIFPDSGGLRVQTLMLFRTAPVLNNRGGSEQTTAATGLWSILTLRKFQQTKCHNVHTHNVVYRSFIIIVFIVDLLSLLWIYCLYYEFIVFIMVLLCPDIGSK